MSCSLFIIPTQHHHYHLHYHCLGNINQSLHVLITYMQLFFLNLFWMFTYSNYSNYIFSHGAAFPLQILSLGQLKHFSRNLTQSQKEYSFSFLVFQGHFFNIVEFTICFLIISFINNFNLYSFNHLFYS